MLGRFISAYCLAIFFLPAILQTSAAFPMGGSHHNQTNECGPRDSAPLREPRSPRGPRLTHFLAIDLVDSSSRDELAQSLERFKSDVHPDGIIPPDAVVPVDTLHLTLGVMSLQSRGMVHAAVQMLRNIIPENLLRTVTTLQQGPDEPAKPITVDLQGLGTFEPPQATSLLFAHPVDRTGRLLAMGQMLATHFREAGLVLPSPFELKLHATVVKLANLPGPVCPAPPRKIDARSSLKKYQGWKWAENLTIKRVAIMKMGPKKKYGKNGELIGEEYEELASFELPH